MTYRQKAALIASLAVLGWAVFVATAYVVIRGAILAAQWVLS